MRLTQPGDGTEDTRRRAALSELRAEPDAAEDVDEVVRALVDARMLTTGGDDDERWVDVSHEALIRGWPRLRDWLDDDRAGLRVHRRLTEAANEWQRLGRDEGVLYRGARLVEAVEWRASNEGGLNELERSFLDASAVAPGARAQPGAASRAAHDRGADRSAARDRHRRRARRAFQPHRSGATRRGVLARGRRARTRAVADRPRARHAAGARGAADRADRRCGRRPSPGVRRLTPPHRHARPPRPRLGRGGVVRRAPAADDRRGRDGTPVGRRRPADEAARRPQGDSDERRADP